MSVTYYDEYMHRIVWPKVRKALRQAPRPTTAKGMAKRLGTGTMTVHRWMTYLGYRFTGKSIRGRRAV